MLLLDLSSVPSTCAGYIPLPVTPGELKLWSPWALTRMCTDTWAQYHGVLVEVRGQFSSPTSPRDGTLVLRYDGKRFHQLSHLWVPPFLLFHTEP